MKSAIPDKVRDIIVLIWSGNIKEYQFCQCLYLKVKHLYVFLQGKETEVFRKRLQDTLS